MNEEFDRLWWEVAEGTATGDQKVRLNQLLREDPGLCDYVAQHLIDSAILADELGTRNVVESLSGSPLPAPADMPADRPPVWGNLSISLATLASALLVLIVGLLWHQFSGPDDHLAADNGRAESPPVGSPAVDPAQWPAVVGTVVQSKSCRWNRTLRDDQHLVASRYQLEQGVARILLVNGIELIADASDDPVEFEIATTSRSVVLHAGSLIANVHPEETGFVIETSTTKVVDVGTQFSVRVDDQGRSLVDVLEGAVACSPIHGPTTPNQSIFSSESATRFIADDDANGELVAGRRESLRRLQETAREDTSPTADLIAFEPFGDSPNAPGFGWSGPWCFARSGNRPATLIVPKSPIQGAPAWLRNETPDHLVQPIYSVKNRKLSSPVDLSIDQDYYVSVLMRRRTVDDSKTTGRSCGVSLYSSASGLKNDGLGLSLDNNDRFTVWTGDERYNGGLPVDPEQPYFVVMKVTATKSRPDNVFVRVYQQGTPVDVIAPKTWHAIGKPTDTDKVVDAVALWTEPGAVAFFDELRVGLTWRSVVATR